MLDLIDLPHNKPISELQAVVKKIHPETRENSSSSAPSIHNQGGKRGVRGGQKTKQPIIIQMDASSKILEFIMLALGIVMI